METAAVEEPRGPTARVARTKTGVNFEHHVLEYLDSQLKKREFRRFSRSALINQIKDVLGDTVKDVRTSSRLTSSPSCLVSDEQDMSANLQRILKASGQEVPDAKRILEINTEHALVQRLSELQDEEAFAKISHVLLDQAALVENGRLDDPGAFVNRINELLLSA